MLTDRLREARASKGWTQVEAEKACELPTTAYALFEGGFREPGLTNLRKLCRGLEVSADVLLELQ